MESSDDDKADKPDDASEDPDQHQEHVEDDSTGSDAENDEDGFPVATTTLSIILLIIAGIYGYSAYIADGAEQPEPYNGFTFTYTQQGFYETTVQGAKGETALKFREHPSDVENISMAGGVDVILRAIQARNGTLYLSVAPEYAEGGRVGIALFEVSKITNYMFGIDTQGAVTANNVSQDYPVVTCENVTERTGVITIEPGNTTIIEQNNGCIEIKAETSDDVIRAADRLVYSLLGIIE
jgi:hypothetical protein